MVVSKSYRHSRNRRKRNSASSARSPYYHSKGLGLKGHTWAAQLVEHLLTMVHNQWIQRNSVVHERDANGLRLKEGIAMEEAIETQFAMGTEGLYRRDHHFISRGRNEVNDMHSSEKKAWLSGILLARESHKAEQTANSSDTGRMRQNMRHWLSQTT